MDPQVTKEIETLEILKHPLIPRLLGSGYFKELGNAMVLEPVGTLISELKGSISMEETRDLMENVNEALQFAHSKRYLHCDISPNNIVVADKRAVLIDWGIAMLQDGIGLSKCIGTSLYSSLAVLFVPFCE